MKKASPPMPFAAGSAADTPFKVSPSGVSPDLRYDGRVAVVTGAGNGLGKAYALMLAARGAKVVVNDLGGAVQGDGSGTAAADAVVAEIKAAGGEAVADYRSVEFGEEIVQTAVGKFGRVDIVVNNAGILRDKSLRKMAQKDWDLIYQVHLKGTFSVTKAAWEHMYKQSYGRIVNVTSVAGLYGNYGQTNYSAMKMGIVGFTMACAREGADRNIFANVVAPLGGTRMLGTVTSKEVVEALKPEFVSPVVGFLAHETSGANGGIYEVGAGWISKLRWQRSEGVAFDSPFSVEDVARNHAKIMDFETRPHFPSSAADSMAIVMGLHGLDRSKSKL